MEVPTKWDDAPLEAPRSALLGKVSLWKAVFADSDCVADSMVRTGEEFFTVKEVAGAAILSRSCQEMSLLTKMSWMWSGYILSEPFLNPFSFDHL